MKGTGTEPLKLDFVTLIEYSFVRSVVTFIHKHATKKVKISHSTTLKQIIFKI